MSGQFKQSGQTLILLYFLYIYFCKRGTFFRARLHFRMAVIFHIYLLCEGKNLGVEEGKRGGEEA